MADRYRVEARLGEGPFGTAYRAWEHDPGRHVGLQLLRPGFAAADVDDANFQRIMREVRDLSHEHALSVLDFGRNEEGQHYVVTEHFDGRPLDQLIADLGPMAQRRAVTICAQVADVLATAHAQGLVHAGLTARAVVLGPDHEGPPIIKLRDFGLARLLPDPAADDLDTEAVDPALRDLIASMGPERALQGRVEPRSDVYALGALLYQLVRGRSLSIEGRQDSPGPGRPFMAAEDVDLYGLHDDLADLIFGLLASEPDERIQGASEAAKILLSLAGGRGRAQLTPNAMRVPGPGLADAGRGERPTISEAGFRATGPVSPVKGATGLEFGTLPTLGRRESVQPARHPRTAHWTAAQAAGSERADQAAQADEELPPPHPGQSWRGPPTGALPPWRRTGDQAATKAAVEEAQDEPTAEVQTQTPEPVSRPAMAPAEISGDRSGTTPLGRHRADRRMRQDTVLPNAAELLAAAAQEGIDLEPTEEIEAPDMRRWTPAAGSPAAEGADVLPPMAAATPVSEEPAGAATPPRTHRVMPSNVSVSASGAFLPWRNSGGIKPVDPARDLTNSQIVTALDAADEPTPALGPAPEGGQEETDDDGAPRSIEDILAVDRFFDGTVPPEATPEPTPKPRPDSAAVAADAPATAGFWRTERGRWLVRVGMAALLFAAVLYFAVWHGQPQTHTPADGTGDGGRGSSATATAPPPGAAAAPFAATPTTPSTDEGEESGDPAGGIDESGAATSTSDALANRRQDREPVAELPAGMLRVAADTYGVGCKVTHDRCRPDAMPMHRVALTSYGIMEQEVSVSEYRRCVRAGECRAAGLSFQCNARIAGRAGHPINCVGWADADAYCRFRDWRLPTEAEWEVAARGRELRVYPWGSQWPSCGHTVLRTFSGAGCGKAGTSPAGQHPGDRSWIGAHGLGGNVSEWVADDYGPYPGGHIDDGPARKVLRGGNFNMDARGMVAVYERLKERPDARRPDVGFRCAVDVQ